MRQSLCLPLQSTLAHQTAQRKRARVRELAALLSRLRQGLCRCQDIPIHTFSSITTNRSLAARKERDIHRSHRTFVQPNRPVRCRKLDDADGEIEWAYTLAAAPGPMRIAREADEPVPSERYLGYLREGARLSGLPGSWCSYLDGMSHDPAAPLPIPAEDTAWAKSRK